ncbi:MAG: hypothetical protein IJX55_10475 [Clostridia bacterium]|nr:hypothetical protein [Clostridia bacterium]
MLKLIRAGIFRYIHSTAFKVCSALALAVGFIFAHNIYKNVELDESWFFTATIIFASLIAINVGGEISKCAKNKITAGYSKTKIFLSELIVANLAILFFFVLFLLFSFVMNVRLLPHIPLKLALLYIFGFMCISVSLATVFFSITCIIPKKAVSAILCLVLLFSLYYTSDKVDYALEQPEFMQQATIDENGEWFKFEVENPEYIKEPLRSIYTFYSDINPFGQREKYETIIYPYLFDDARLELLRKNTQEQAANPEYLLEKLERNVSESEWEFIHRAPLYALAPVPVFTLAGWLVFRKKEFR